MLNSVKTLSEQEHNKFYVSVPNQKLSQIEIRLKNIFENELKSKDTVLVGYKSEVVKKLAAYITGTIGRSASIGIAGETASGKSTITLDIIDTISDFANKYNLENIITRVNTDDYYYDRSDMVRAAGSFSEFAKHYDLDVPDALELELMHTHIKELLSGKSVYLPKYDMSGTAIRYDNYKLTNPSKIIISEGLFTLTPKIKDSFDFKIYVDVRHNVQKERFYIRAQERHLGDSAHTIYKNASQKAEIYIRPCKQEADIILSGEAVRTRYKNFLNKIISVIEEEYFI